MNNMDHYMEDNKEKKALKIFFSSGRYAGVAVGLLLLSLLSPVLGNGGLGDALAGVFSQYAFYMFGYIAIMVVTYLFVRKYIFFMNGVMQWLVLPTIAILFVMDGYEAIMNMPPMEEMEVKADDTARGIMDDAMEEVGL